MPEDWTWRKYYIWVRKCRSLEHSMCYVNTKMLMVACWQTASMMIIIVLTFRRDIFHTESETQWRKLTRNTPFTSVFGATKKSGGWGEERGGGRLCNKTTNRKQYVETNNNDYHESRIYNNDYNTPQWWYISTSEM